MSEFEELIKELVAMKFQSTPSALNRRAALGTELAELLLLRRGFGLDDRELNLVVEALDSHAYWQLSDPNYRDSGYVQPPGSDDPETVDALAETDELHDRLEAEQRARGVGPFAEQG